MDRRMCCLCAQLRQPNRIQASMRCSLVDMFSRPRAKRPANCEGAKNLPNANNPFSFSESTRKKTSLPYKTVQNHCRPTATTYAALRWRRKATSHPGPKPHCPKRAGSRAAACAGVERLVRNSSCFPLR